MNDEANEIQVNIDEAKHFVRLGEALDRLHNNVDFKMLITEDYLREEAVRLVGLRGSPQMQQLERQEAILKAIDSISGLRQYFGKVYHQAEMANSAIESGEEELASLEDATE